MLRHPLLHKGVSAALGAAVLFGLATPLAKGLLQSIDPWLLAGLLYLGSGGGLSVYRAMAGLPAVRLAARDRLWFAGAVLAGGVVAPLLLMFGLTGAAASDAALLLNMEGVFTATLAWFLFKENFDRRIALGMLAIVAGTVLLSWPGEAGISGLWPSMAILGACLAWGIDNNLTRKVALTDASWIASVKGLIAGSVNFGLALASGAALPSLPTAAAALLLGFLSYGLSLVLFVLGLRHLGTARTAAYFSVAPLFGALYAVLTGEPLSWPLIGAGVLMATGVWLHLSERHQHGHAHEALAHAHEHDHDAHHDHAHAAATPPLARHQHWHVHEAMAHEHPHYPDAHHQHRH